MTETGNMTEAGTIPIAPDLAQPPPLLCDLERPDLFDRIRLVMVKIATVTCEHCGRRWYKPLVKKLAAEERGEINIAVIAQTVPRCSECSQLAFKKPTATRRGKLISWQLLSGSAATDWGDEDEPASDDDILSEAALKSWACWEQERQNRESLEREEIMTPEWIRGHGSPEELRDVARLLANSSRAELARRYALPEHVVRNGKTDRVFALLEAAGACPEIGQPSRNVPG